MLNFVKQYVWITILRCHVCFTYKVYEQQTAEGTVIDAVVAPVESSVASNILMCTRRCAEGSQCRMVAYQPGNQSCLHSNGNQTNGTGQDVSNLTTGWLVYSSVDQDNVFYNETTTTATPAVTGPGWTYYSGSSFLLATERLNWTASRDACVAKGGYLATVTSMEEQDFLMDLINTTYTQVFDEDDRLFTWLGGSDLAVDGTWVWLTGEPWSFEHWFPGEPSGESLHSTPEHCLDMFPMQWGEAMWNDHTCEEEFPYVCEKDE